MIKIVKATMKKYSSSNKSDEIIFRPTPYNKNSSVAVYQVNGRFKHALKLIFMCKLNISLNIIEIFFDFLFILCLNTHVGIL